MTKPYITLDELRELRQQRRCCIECGKRLPRYPETQDGGPHFCFRCAWEWRWGETPEAA